MLGTLRMMISNLFQSFSNEWIKLNSKTIQNQINSFSVWKKKNPPPILQNEKNLFQLPKATQTSFLDFHLKQLMDIRITRIKTKLLDGK